MVRGGGGAHSDNFYLYAEALIQKNYETRVFFRYCFKNLYTSCIIYLIKYKPFG